MGAEFQGSRKKSVAERQQDALDEIAQLVKDVNDGFAFKTPDIAKRYVEGRFEICLKFRTGRGGQELTVAKLEIVQNGWAIHGFLEPLAAFKGELSQISSGGSLWPTATAVPRSF